MSDYFDSFDCQIQCEEMYNENEYVSDEELATLIESSPDEW